MIWGVLLAAVLAVVTVKVGLARRRRWRVGHTGRDNMYYEERVNGQWERLEVQGEMLTGRAHHVIYFSSETVWRDYPDWARDRRDEIIGRIKRGFPPPDYEYHGG